MYAQIRPLFTTLLVAILLHVVVDRAAATEDATKAKPFPGLTCFECVEGVDKNCGDPFDKDDLEIRKSYLKNCTVNGRKPYTADDEDREEFDFRKREAVGCRKVYQEIDGNITVVRQCAWGAHDVHGLKRTGNKGVRLYYYQCSDHHDCNGAARNVLHFSVAMISVPLIAKLVFF